MKNVKLSLFILLFAIALYAIFAILTIKLTNPFNDYSLEKAGQIGDSFGVLTSLFTVFAFSGMIITIFMQKEELELQWDELSLTRLEIAAQKEILRKQSFTEIFFKILDYYKSNLEQVTVLDKTNNNTLTGVSALKYLHGKFEENQRENQPYHIKDNADLIKVFKYNLFVGVETILLKKSRYLQTFISILDHIRLLSKVEERNIYYSLIESQLTVHEIRYLFYHSLIDTNKIFIDKVIESNILSIRAPDSGIPKTHLDFFNEIHGTSINLQIRKRPRPYTKREINKIKKDFKLGKFDSA